MKKYNWQNDTSKNVDRNAISQRYFEMNQEKNRSSKCIYRAFNEVNQRIEK